MSDNNKRDHTIPSCVIGCYLGSSFMYPLIDNDKLPGSFCRIEVLNWIG